ncbi:MAG: hypothetical protein KF789_09030, partial [Bdellovibrionaceae bacterium]|nr:hypothetical protein [Pseudobdellovibrionaceae bacterium]
MSQKVNKSKKQSATNWETIRVCSDFTEAATAKLDAINDKDTGRKIRMDEMLTVALGKLTTEDV